MKIPFLQSLWFCAIAQCCLPAMGQCVLSYADGRSLVEAYHAVTGKSLREVIRSEEPKLSSFECISFSSIVAVHVPKSRFALVLDSSRAFFRWEMTDGGSEGHWQEALRRYIGYYLQTSAETLAEVFGRAMFSEQERNSLKEAIGAKSFSVESMVVSDSLFESRKGIIAETKAALLSKAIMNSVCSYFETRWPDYWIVQLEIDPVPDFDSVVNVRIKAKSSKQDKGLDTQTLSVGVSINPNMAPLVGRVYPNE